MTGTVRLHPSVDHGTTTEQNHDRGLPGDGFPQVKAL